MSPLFSPALNHPERKQNKIYRKGLASAVPLRSAPLALSSITRATRLRRKPTASPLTSSTGFLFNKAPSASGRPSTQRTQRKRASIIKTKPNKKSGTLVKISKESSLSKKPRIKLRRAEIGSKPNNGPTAVLLAKTTASKRGKI